MTKSKKENVPISRAPVQSSTPKIKIQLKAPACPAEKEKPPSPKEVAQTETSPAPDVPATPDQPVQRRPPASTQCFRCQLWGHKSFACSGENRCVKCGKNHRSSECPKSPDEPPTCANCSGAHPASYRGCPAAPKRRRRRRRPQRRRKLPFPGVPKEKVSRLVQIACKLLTRPDFFSEEQLAIIAKDLMDEPVFSDVACQSPDLSEIAPPTNIAEVQTDPEPTPPARTATCDVITQTDDTANQMPASPVPKMSQPSPVPVPKPLLKRRTFRSFKDFLEAVESAPDPDPKTRRLTWWQFQELPETERSRCELSFFKNCKDTKAVKSYFYDDFDDFCRRWGGSVAPRRY